LTASLSVPSNLNLVSPYVQHKDRYVLGVTIYITKLSGFGMDSVFMGMFTVSFGFSKVILLLEMSEMCVVSTS
jgi:hypothetical protein